MQISQFINPFDDCKKACSQKKGKLAAIMIDDLLRTLPEMVTWARNGHIKAVVLLFMYYWMQI